MSNVTFSQLRTIEQAQKKDPGYRWGQGAPQWLLDVVAAGFAEERSVRGLRYAVLTDAGRERLALLRGGAAS